MNAYADFLASKRLVAQVAGKSVALDDIHPMLFPFQRVLVRWCVAQGRAALLCDTGLGKSFMQIEWARLLGYRTLIVAPLTVARQTVGEAARLGVTVTYARAQEDAAAEGITITNYDNIHNFDGGAWGAVVLDESSILKSLDGKTKARLTAMFADTPYRLCCTATPAPNDITEIANHAEFLGIMRRVDMLAAFFVHDDEGWRLKGHAENPFYQWMASWAMSVRHPSDIGYSDQGYILPPLTVEPLWVDAPETEIAGQLFFTGLKGIGDRTRVRKGTMAERIAATAEMVNASPDPWIVWAGLNDESTALAKTIPGAVDVHGSLSPDEKASRIEAFQRGDYRVLVSKPKVAGFGLNLQHCAHMAFVGLSDSWEAYYQCIRRCYRFGQERPVHAYVVLSQMEEGIYQNVMRKEGEAARMSERLIEHVKDIEQAELGGSLLSEADYTTDIAHGRNWTLMLGDSVERLAEIPDNSVDLTVSSPPFMSLYTYHPSARDVGNCRTVEEFKTHFGLIVSELLRVTKPGRNCCLHVQQLATTLVSHGVIGLDDFRGRVIALAIERGWVYHGEVCVDADPQAQAIRSHAKGLLFVQKDKDSSWSRPGLADYIIILRKPGENAVPITPDVTNDEWIVFAHPVWYDIRRTDTLNVAVARDAPDERHICALQLGTIERCIRLWSNPGETVLDPFGGISSTPYQAVKLGRRGLSIELKPSYFKAGLKNMHEAEDSLGRPALFDMAEVS